MNVKQATFKTALSVLFLGAVISFSSCRGGHGACDAYTSDINDITKAKEARTVFAQIDAEIAEIQESM